MEIISMEIKNFKGVESLAVELNGDDARITGPNGSGKTTVHDAWRWLIHGKDSGDNKKFQWKPTDEAGNEIHNLETAVSAVVEDDGTETELVRSATEKWVKKRGHSSRVFEGHESTFEVDGVPAKKTEFDERVEALVGSEDTFKLLADPTYFNEHLHWKERRAMLVDMVGGIEDSEVQGHEGIDTGKLSVAKYRQKLTAALKKIKEKTETIGVKLEQAQDDTPEKVAVPDTSELEKQAAAIRGKIDNAKSGNTADLKKELNKLESEKQDIIEAADAEHRKKKAAQDKKINAAEAELQKIRGARGSLASDLQRICDENDTKDERRKRLESRIADMQKDWYAVFAEQYDADKDTCPTCGQLLPAEKRETAREEFNTSKASRLKTITADGKELRSTIDSIKPVGTSELEGKIARGDKAYNEAAEALRQIVENAPEKPTPDFGDITDKQDKIREQIRAVKAGAESDASEFRADLASVERKLTEAQEKAAQNKHREKVLNNVKALEKQRTEAVQAAEDTEQELIAVEEFEYQKNKMLEDKVNELFSAVKFRMFRKRINGTYEDICECMTGGRPYNVMSTGERIRAGIDIINAFGRAGDLNHVPVFIDNAESVTGPWKSVEYQRIFLAADEDTSILNITIT